MASATSTWISHWHTCVPCLLNPPRHTSLSTLSHRGPKSVLYTFLLDYCSPVFLPLQSGPPIGLEERQGIAVPQLGGLTGMGDGCGNSLPYQRHSTRACLPHSLCWALKPVVLNMVDAVSMRGELTENIFRGYASCITPIQWMVTGGD